MLIPIDRPLIDARNIRDAATQTVSAGFVATHNQRSVLLLTCDEMERVSAAPHIQAGVRVGQQLLILVTDDTAQITITDGAGTGTQLNGDWVVADGEGIGAKLWLVWDGTRWWEVDRKNGELDASGLVAYAEGSATTASGEYSHAEGDSTTASGSRSHAEGSSTTSSNYYSHAEGTGCVASGNSSHAEGRNNTASGYASHAGGYDSLANLYGQYAHASQDFAVQGDAQFSRFVGHKLLTMSNVGQNILFLDGDDDLLVIPANSLFAFEGIVVGLDDVSVGAVNKTSYKIYGTIWRDNAGNTTLLGQTIVTMYEEDASYLCVLAADDVNEALEIQMLDTDNDGASVRWVATVWGTRVSFP